MASAEDSSPEEPMPTQGRTARPMHIAVRWRQDLSPDALTDAEVDVLHRHLAELMREVLLLQDADEPTE
jgi:hypothetical protein